MFIKTNEFRKNLTNATLVFRISGLQYFRLDDVEEFSHHGSKISGKYNMMFAFFVAIAFLHDFTIIIGMNIMEKAVEAENNENIET